VTLNTRERFEFIARYVRAPENFDERETTGCHELMHALARDTKSNRAEMWTRQTTVLAGELPEATNFVDRPSDRSFPRSFALVVERKFAIHT
jgi:hypothetical protein